MDFSNLSTNKQVEKETDILPGEGFKRLSSDVYPMMIDMAYVDMAKSEAISLVVTFIGSGDEKLTQTFWLTSGKAKGKKNTYTDKNGKEHFLPGFSQANFISKLVTGKEIQTVLENAEEKVINIYNFEARKELPTKKLVAVDLLKGKVILGVILRKQNKQVKGSTGDYEDTNDVRWTNEVDKVFSEEGLTATEIAAGETESAFMHKWKEKWVGKVDDRFNEVAGAAATTAGAPVTAQTAGKSLFD